MINDTTAEEEARTLRKESFICPKGEKSNVTIKSA
jgi:hypothetical protein